MNCIFMFFELKGMYVMHIIQYTTISNHCFVTIEKLIIVNISWKQALLEKLLFFLPNSPPLPPQSMAQ